MGLIVTAIGVLLALVLITLDNHQAQSGVLVFCLVFLLAQYPLVLLHEIGHAMAARWVRAPAYAIVVGREPWLLDRDLFRIRWRLGLYAGGGLTYHEPCEGSDARRRGVIITAAGPLTNLLIAAVVIAIAATLPGTYSSSLAKAALAVVAFASLVRFLINAWPRRIATEAGRIPNDSARILLYLAGEIPDPTPSRALIYLRRASFAFADEDFEKCLIEADLAQQTWTEPKFANAVAPLRAAALCESDNAAAAVALLNEVQLTEDDDPGVHAGVADNLAWGYLLLDEPESLEKGISLMNKALAIAPWEASFVISQACLLAASATPANARAAEARALLASLKHNEFNRQCAAYTALANALIAVAERDGARARRQEQRARELRATAAPLRLLERRLASL